MKRLVTMCLSFLLGSLACAAVSLIARAEEVSPQEPNAAQSALFEKIESLTGAKGQFNAKEQVFKVSVPRTDLHVKTAGVTVTPPMGLTAWAAFHLMEHQAMVMGDMVLLEDQVNPVMSAALDNGLEVTALHNHFLWDSPRVIFMHIGGSGDPEQLAAAVGKVFAAMKSTSGGEGLKPFAKINPAKTTLDPAKIEQILGVKGQLKDGVYKIVIGLTTTMHGQEIGAAMGVNTWAAFAGSDKQAIVDGDFAMLEEELQPVLKTLRAANIDVVAIHNHMVMESPRIVFLHYWAIGSTEQLAWGLRAALDAQRPQG